MNATQVIDEVQTTARAVAKRKTQRFPEAASPGDAVRQGDVYIRMLSRVPKGAVAISTCPTQLADGTTQGSRHCLDSTDGVTAFARARPTEYDGPILRLDRERTLTHPEHGDWVLPPGVYAIGYQRTIDSEERIQRVRD